MNVTHILGHNSKWNVDSYLENGIGNFFLIAAYTHGVSFDQKPMFAPIKHLSMIDLQFYGKRKQITGGKLGEFPFHPIMVQTDEATNVYFDNCLKSAIRYQKEKGFKNIIVPLFYENESVNDITFAITNMNRYVMGVREEGEKYFMTLPFANHIIIDKQKVEQILFHCTDMEIEFDGFFIVCENKPEVRKKLTTDIKVLRNLSKVFQTLKRQGFETIYGYSNWDVIVILAQTDIDYITIGSYENLRNFDIKRFTENINGGGSKGFYFSERLLNMVRANDVTKIRDTGHLELIRNDRNIFSEIILNEAYIWNIHKPEVNKNYFLSINRLLIEIAGIEDLQRRKNYVLTLIDRAIQNYNILEARGVFLDEESSNYHLNTWKTILTSG